MSTTNRQGDPVNFAGSGAFVITPNDNEALATAAFGIRLENVADGNALKVEMVDGSEITLQLKAFDHGYHPLNIRKVFSTGTTAGLRIIGLK